MADTAPQGDNVPTMSNSTGSEAPQSGAPSAVQSAKDTVVSNATSAYNAVANHPTTQNLASSVQNAPVTQAAKDQAQKTSTSLNNLAASRKTPSATTAGGQQLTNYHSFFYTTLSWQEPHATAISYVAVVTAIFAIRYLNVLPLFFKTACWVLGTTALAEMTGRFVLNQGLASAFRPRRYYTIPRETLEAALEDVEQLINFFVIEAQRILFAENVLNTAAAFVASLTAYLLIKFVPFWGLSLITVTVAYFTPLIYITNKEFIDDILNQASELLNQQTKQIKDLAEQHSSSAASTLKSYTSEYTAKAQEYIGSAKPKAHSPQYSENDFPAAPSKEPEPAIQSEQAVPAS